MEHPDRTAAGVFTGADPTQARLREIDWTASALGPVSRWPVELCTALQIILASPMPMEIDWGPDLTRIFNDTARLNLGAEHLELLGRPWGEAWPDLRAAGEPALRAVLDGHGARRVENYRLLVSRFGYQEETYWTIATSPIAGPDGGVGGVLAMNLETTATVLLARRERLVRDLGDVSVSTARTAAAVCGALMRVLDRDRTVVPCASIYLAGEAGAPPQCLASMGVHASPTQLQTTLTDVDGEDPAAGVLATGEPKRITGLRRTLAPGTFLPNPLGPLVPDEAMVYPLRANIPSAPDGVLVVGISPYRRIDVAYRTFLDLAARHISVILTDARSLETEHGRVRALGEQGRQSQEQTAHLQTALTGNRTVSYAIGILMALSKVTVDDAFALLRACARSSNRKLGEVADDVVHTGALPAVGEAGHRSPPTP